MQIGLVAVGDQGANVVGAVSKTNGNMACKMDGVGRGQGQPVMDVRWFCFALPTRAVTMPQWDLH